LRKIVCSEHILQVHFDIFLRDSLKLNFPSPSSLQKWNSIKKLQPGDNECLYSALKESIKEINASDKEDLFKDHTDFFFLTSKVNPWLIP